MKYLPFLTFIFVALLAVLAYGDKDPRKSALKKTVSNKEDQATKSTKRVKFSDQFLDDSIGKDPLNQMMPKVEREGRDKTASPSQIRKKKQEIQEAKPMIRSSKTDTDSASLIAPPLGLLAMAVLVCFIF